MLTKCCIWSSCMPRGTCHVITDIITSQHSSLLNEKLVFITKCDRVVLQNATAIFITKRDSYLIIKCDSYLIIKCDKRYCVVREVLLQSATGITMCDVVTKCDGTLLPCHCDRNENKVHNDVCFDWRSCSNENTGAALFYNSAMKRKSSHYNSKLLQYSQPWKAIEGLHCQPWHISYICHWLWSHLGTCTFVYFFMIREYLNCVNFVCYAFVDN